MSNRILIFSLAYYPKVGGAEIAIKEITDRIPDLEFDMITLRFSPNDKREEKIGNVNVHRVGGGESYWNKILFVPRAAFLALKLAKERHYRAFWAMMTYMLFPIVLARILGNRISYVLTLQDGDPYEHVFARARIFPFLPLLLYGFRHASKVQTISNFLASWARHMGYAGDLFVIPNGVDVEKFKGPRRALFSTEDVILITTSRLVKKNGISDIIESLKHLPSKFKLKVIGTGKLENDLRMLSVRLGLESRVEFLGFVPLTEIPRHLHSADIFVRPSLSEGMGSSFIEAMAAGVPVIATRVGGIPDFLVDKETGIFCEINNPKSIAEKAMEYANNLDLAERVARNAREMVEKHYDWNTITSEMKTRIFDKV